MSTSDLRGLWSTALLVVGVPLSAAADVTYLGPTDDLQAAIDAASEGATLVLAPGNKSELAVGYSTIYGDAVGGFPQYRLPVGYSTYSARTSNLYTSDLWLAYPKER